MEAKLKYWAKTTAEGEPGIDVGQHLLRVASVAQILAERRAEMLRRFGLDPRAIFFLAGGHDVGKIAAGFQSKCVAWLKKYGLLEESDRNAWTSLERDHSKISQFTVQEFLMQGEWGLKRTSAVWWAAAVGCHHGRIHYGGERGLAQAPGMSRDEWEEERRKTAERLHEIAFGPHGKLSLPSVTPDSPELWWVAGLTSIADWIGSDETIFPPDRDLSAEETIVQAAHALDSFGLHLPQVMPGLEFHDIFPFPPNKLQTSAMELILSPGLYVIEAPMGIGKTEAALAAAYRLLAEGHASGIYFALPTQATSNRIYKRLHDFVQTICPGAPPSRLIHANSWLIEDLPYLVTSSGGADDESAQRGRDWFASSKRALLAPFGVGTIDQALLAVLAVRHFFVRRFALAGKVVIIDEVHSYDVYTGTLVGRLCEELEALGCTVILLSATLTQKRRRVLLGVKTGSNGGALEPYPMISNREFEVPTLSGADDIGTRRVGLRFQSDETAMAEAIELARAGGCVLWVCNTVDRAQEVFRRVKCRAGGDFTFGVLHSRFPFFRRRELEDHWMEVLGKYGPRPNGCVLVSTQIVEQSVDLDADLIVTELAPIDMVLQRIGRLWRHPREMRPKASPECVILQETTALEFMRDMPAEEIERVLGAKAKVYAPYVLLRSLETLARWPEIVISSDATARSEVRAILEETYADAEDEPPGWLKLRNTIEGSRFAEKITAETRLNLFSPALPDDEEGGQTRLIEFKTVSLVLAKKFKAGSAVLLNGEAVRLPAGEFHIETARALHRNLVRVPEWMFADFRTAEETSMHVRGKQAVALVEKGGGIVVPGCKPDVHLLWDNDLGLVILRDGKENNESCD